MARSERRSGAVSTWGRSLNRSAFVQLGLVGLGGGLGSVLRFLVSGWSHRLLPELLFPVGTVAVNVLGCLAIGLLAGVADLRQALGPQARVFLMIGVLGGFTTFSTFAYESLELTQGGEAAKALINVAGQLVLGLAAAWLGYSLAKVV